MSSYSIKNIKSIGSILNLVEIIELNIGKIFLSIVMILLTIRVVQRYIFRSIPLWLPTVSSALFYWVVILSICYTFKKRGHIAITFFTDHFPEKIKNLINLSVYILCSFTFLALFSSAINIIPTHSQNILIGIKLTRATYSIGIAYLAFSCLISSVYFIYLEIKNIKKYSVSNKSKG